MFGRHPDAAYWLGEALAVPGGRPSPDRDCALAVHLLNRVDPRPGMSAQDAEADRARVRELADRLLAHPELPGPHGLLSAFTLALLEKVDAAVAAIERETDGEDLWLSGLARMLRAEYAENSGDLDRVRTDVEEAITRFRQAGDRWGQATVLPMRAQLRQYDDDLDGALADLREARSLAGEFGSLSLGDEVFVDLRWVDLHLRRGDTDLALAMIDSARERARPAHSPATVILVDAWEADFRIRVGDLDRARELLDEADLGLRDHPSFPGDHALTLTSSVRSALCLALGDLPGAHRALTTAYATALVIDDLPLLSVVAVHVAALAEARGLHHETAVLLGAASRLRGTHDRTDGQVRDLTRHGRAALGEDAFAAAYSKGWELDRATALAEADPARLGR